jgi:predicted PurR-regulated permease PerM
LPPTPPPVGGGGPPPDAKSATLADRQPISPATGYEKVAWLLMAASLWFVLQFTLVPALATGLFVYGLIRALTARYSGNTLSHGRAKIVAVSLLGLLVVGAVAGLAVLLAAFLKGGLGDLPATLDKMAAVIEGLRERMGGADWIPATGELRDSVSKGLRDHARELRQVGSEMGRALMHALVGIVIGALACFEARSPDSPLLLALAERARRFADAFDTVVFAQVKISALNTILTGIYLLVALPLFGVDLPLRKTLVVIAFIAGLIPIVGNLVSNTTIVVIALGTSLPAAMASLVFLVVVHKLEYFMNARIVGGEIHAAAWEVVLSIVCFEAVFGMPGVVVAPIVYAYLKQELADRGLL